MFIDVSGPFRKGVNQGPTHSRSPALRTGHRNISITLGGAHKRTEKRHGTRLSSHG